MFVFSSENNQISILYFDKHFLLLYVLDEQLFLYLKSIYVPLLYHLFSHIYLCYGSHNPYQTHNPSENYIFIYYDV
jgi:hypothetical protein